MKNDDNNCCSTEQLLKIQRAKKSGAAGEILRAH